MMMMMGITITWTVSIMIIIWIWLHVDGIDDHRSWSVDNRFRLHVDSRSNAAG